MIAFGTKNKPILYRITWIVLIVASLLAFVSMWYSDLFITYRHGLMLIDSIVDNRFFDFYTVTVEREYNAAYSIPIYIIFAVWNIPTWILTRIVGMPEDAVVCLLWAKALLLAFLSLAMMQIYKIAKLREIDEEKVMFMFMSSLFVFCPLMAVGQYDIIGIVFSLCAIRKYLEDGRLSALSIFLFSISASMKFFALFPYLILVLLVEKRVIRICINLLFGVLFNFVVMIPFASGYKTSSGSFNGGMLQRLFTVCFPGGNVNISLFCLLFSTVCVLAFLSNRKTSEEIFDLWIWMGTFTWLSFFVFMEWAFPYWIIWMAPFMILLIGTKSEYSRVNVLFETVLEAGFTFMMAYVYYWVYLTPGVFDKLLLKSVFSSSDYSGKSLKDIVDWLHLDICLPGICAITLVIGVVLLVINNPWKKLLPADIDGGIICSEGFLRTIRGCFLTIFFVASILCNIDLGL